MTNVEDTSVPLQGTVRRIRRLPGPLEALERLGRGPHAFLRMCVGPGASGARWSFLGVRPRRIIEHRVVPTSKDLADLLAPLRPRRVIRHGPRVPFGGGWAGVLGYDARTGVEARPDLRAGPLRFPAIWLGYYDAVLAWHHNTGTCYVAGLGETRHAARAAGRRLEEAVRSGHSPEAAAPVAFSAPRARSGQQGFRSAVLATRRAVLRGDIFQANVSQRFDARAKSDIDPVALFGRLVESQPAPHMTYVDLGRERHVLSASPERFLRTRGRVVETEPMKGTRPRGATRGEDQSLRAELEASEKERAELAMIVDLSRNDLARSCAVGSVRVRVPRRLLRFARVHQAIAIVKGRIAKGKDRVDVLRAAFPPGSVTGAPKVRAMEIIDELEGEGRGPYCGALGWFDAGTDMDLSVAIRTILLSRRTASYRVGAGITLRSEVEEEWRETLDKGRGLFAALRLEEDPA